MDKNIMCGISGFCDFSRKTSEDHLRMMTDVLQYRGPDASGYSFYDTREANIGLGHRRLSILDLSIHGHQPMRFDNLEIIYNGEVYNFKEIKHELIKYGYTFNSDSDTEVLLKGYHKWGVKLFEKLNGMFAIAIYDIEKKKILLLRDRCGVKPLYWYWHEDLFMFASELKSFHNNPYFKKRIDKNALSLFLQYGYIKQPYSIFQNTYKLRAGYFIEINISSKNIKETKYWDLKNSYNKDKLNLNEEEAIDHTEELMKSSFLYRMVSDVPVGVFLSGGYDSSAVTALIQSEMSNKIKTFSIGFHENKYNEAGYAKQVSSYLGTDHTEYYCTQKDALDILPILPEIYDEPFGDSSAIPTVLVSKLAKKSVTVALSADGGDEMFGGYDSYSIALNQYKKLSSLPKPLKDISRSIAENTPLTILSNLLNVYNIEGKYNKFIELMNAKELGDIFDINSKYFQSRELKKLLNSYIEKQNNQEKTFTDLLYKSFIGYLSEDIMTKVDRATMSVSLEGREPFLDYRLLDFVARLPDKYKIKDGNKKYLLKQIVHKYVPKDIMDRKKMGFSVPVFEWFRDELKEYINYYLEESRIKRAGIFDEKEVTRLKTDYFNGSGNPHKLWLLITFEMWREKWM